MQLPQLPIGDFGGRALEKRAGGRGLREGDDVPKAGRPGEEHDQSVEPEREAGVRAERPVVAGVFVRRLEQGMRLQTDPTVMYGLGPDFKGPLRTIHLRTDTPYNTYTRHGLPPTPISLPGASALRAAVQPADGDALFFVSRGDGTHHFSATLEEHNRAVRRYILGRGDDGS